MCLGAGTQLCLRHGPPAPRCWILGETRDPPVQPVCRQPPRSNCRVSSYCVSEEQGIGERGWELKLKGLCPCSVAVEAKLVMSLLPTPQKSAVASGCLVTDGFCWRLIALCPTHVHIRKLLTKAAFYFVALIFKCNFEFT